MPSFNECIDIAVKAGKVTRDIGEQIKVADDQQLALNQFAESLSRQKRETAIQAVRIAEGFENMTSHSEGAYDGLNALMTKDPKGLAGYGNVDYRQKFYTNKYSSMFAEALSRFRTRRVGFEQDEVGLEKFIRAIYGESVDDVEIMEFAKSWNVVTETARKDFNAKGGSISKNEAWLLPQNHDMASVLKMGLEGWKTLIGNKLDRSKMLDDAGNPLSDKNFDEALDYVFETITTGGLNKTTDFTVPMLGTKLSRRGAEKRFLYFKDAESWMQYQKVAGRGDIFTTLTDWFEMKGSDVGLMEVMGVNPRATFDTLSAMARKKKAFTGNQKRQSEAIFNEVSGKTNSGEMTGLSDFVQTTRNVLVASTLGKAFLSALGDVAFSGITAKYDGMAATRTLAKQLALMDPSKEADRIFAVKLGLGADAWLGRAHGSNRYADIYGTGFTAKLAEGVMRASLLAPWTDAGQKAFGMEFSSMLAENFGKTIDELDSPVKRAFDTYGITADDWNLFRAGKTLDFKGAKYADMMQPGGVKFHQMVMSETDYAVPMPDARTRAITTGGLGRSTIEGQAWRSVMMLKSFPITIATTHFYRAAYQSTAGEKLGYIGALVASTTVMGGLSLQAKDIAAGRKPRAVDQAFIGQALAQGGGLGIFGDFILSDVNRFGGGIMQTIVGPMGQLANTATAFTLGNVRQAMLGEETNVLGEGAKILNRYTPDIWQTQLFSNAVYDQMLLMADPDAEQKFRRIIKRRQKEYNQGYWWKPGKPVPEAIK